MQPIEQKWTDAATNPEVFHTQKIIDSSIGSSDDFRADEKRIRALSVVCREDRPCTWLDFGAGMLRNAAYLRDMSPKWTVIAYDNEAMLRRGWKWLGFPEQDFHPPLCSQDGRLICVSDWPQVASMRTIDAILCNLVLQHIPVDQLREALRDFASLSPWLCVYGRRVVDGTEDSNVSKLVVESGLWEPRFFEPQAFDGGPDSHALAIFGRTGK